MLREPSIAAGFARALLDLSVSKGAARAELARRSGIALADLEDQDNRVPFLKFVRLMRAAKELTKDPALALHFGEAYDFSELSIVGLLGGACENLTEALAQLERYSRLVVDVDLADGARGRRLVLERIGGKHWFVDMRTNPNEFPEMTESSFARMVCTSRRLGGGKSYIGEVHVTHPAPSYRDEYQRIFRVPVVFDSPRNALMMTDDSWMNMKPVQPSRYVFGVLSERAESLLKELETTDTTRGRVEALLLPLLHTGDAGMELVARRMGMSRQTLFRRLRTEGVTFEMVLDGLRHKMALNYLSERKVSVNETAYLVGFSEPAAFSRAFKRWTGSSPRAARS